MSENKEDLTNSNTSMTNWEEKLKENEKTAMTIEPEIKTAHTSTVFGLTKDEEIQEKTYSAKKTFKTPKNRGNFWFFLLLVCFCISAVCGAYLTVKPGMSCSKKDNNTINNFSFSSSKKDKQSEGIAWIKVRGVIAEESETSPFSIPSGASYISKRIREAAKEDHIKAIVLDINSPGGTVASVQDIHAEILAAKEKGKKVVALFRDVAASGAFYIAMAADKIVAEPGTITGSVGVIMQAGNVVGLFNKLGISVTPITSGKYKDMGSAYRPMTEAEKAILQDMVDDTYQQFLSAVKAGRPNVKPEDMAAYTDGRIFTGSRAFKLGFIDKLGGEETARLLAGELAGIKDPKIFTQRKEGLREMIFSFGSNLESKDLAKQLQTMNTPSVSYLWVL